MFNDDIHFQFQVSLNPNAGYCSWQQPGGGGGRRLVKWCRTQYLDTEGAAPSTRAGQTQIKQTSLLLPTEQSVLDREAFDIWFMTVYCFSSSFVIVHSLSHSPKQILCVCPFQYFYALYVFESWKFFSTDKQETQSPPLLDAMPPPAEWVRPGLITCVVPCAAVVPGPGYYQRKAPVHQNSLWGWVTHRLLTCHHRLIQWKDIPTPMIVHLFSPIIAVSSRTNNEFWATFVFLYIYSIICCSAALKLQSLGNLKNLLNIEFSLKHKHQILSGPLPTIELPAHNFFHVLFREKSVAIFH